VIGTTKHKTVIVDKAKLSTSQIKKKLGKIYKMI